MAMFLNVGEVLPFGGNYLLFKTIGMSGYWWIIRVRGSYETQQDGDTLHHKDFQTLPLRHFLS